MFVSNRLNTLSFAGGLRPEPIELGGEGGEALNDQIRELNGSRWHSARMEPGAGEAPQEKEPTGRNPREKGVASWYQSKAASTFYIPV